MASVVTTAYATARRAGSLGLDHAQREIACDADEEKQQGI